MIFPAREFRSWARAASSLTMSQFAAAEVDIADAVPVPLRRDAVGAHGELGAGRPDVGTKNDSLGARQRSITDDGVTAKARGLRSGVVGRARVIRVKEINEPVSSEVRVECHANQAPVPVVVHLRADVDHRRREERSVLEDTDDAALLGDEDPAVRGERERGREVEARHDGLRLEAQWRGHGGPRRTLGCEAPRQQHQRQRQRAQRDKPPQGPPPHESSVRHSPLPIGLGLRIPAFPEISPRIVRSRTRRSFRTPVIARISRLHLRSVDGSTCDKLPVGERLDGVVAVEPLVTRRLRRRASLQGTRRPPSRGNARCRRRGEEGQRHPDPLGPRTWPSERSACR